MFNFCLIVFFLSCSCNKDELVVPKVSILENMESLDENESIFGLSYVATRNEISATEMIPVKDINANYLPVIPFAIGINGESSLHFDDNNQW